MSEGALPHPVAWRHVSRCLAVSLAMLARREIRLPTGNVGRVLRFQDGSSARVYRETVVTRPAPGSPCFLAVRFRLRRVRGRGHRLFRLESILNTPLFVGFPGFVSKLWLAHDEHGFYRGLYEWDGAERAMTYARSLWRVLALVSEPGSIDYHVVPGVRRDEALSHPDVVDQHGPGEPAAWWRPVSQT